MFSAPETSVHVLDKNREISPLDREIILLALSHKAHRLSVVSNFLNIKASMFSLSFQEPTLYTYSNEPSAE